MKTNAQISSSKSTTVTAGLMVLGITGAASVSHAATWTDLVPAEKCYGVAKAGKNDCATKNHQCAGQSKVDKDPDSWVYLPKGVSAKLGGAVKPEATACPIPNSYTRGEKHGCATKTHSCG